MPDFTRALPGNLLLALFLVSESRAAEVDGDNLRELLAAGLVANVGSGWVLSAAGARRVRSFEPGLRAELQAVSQIGSST